MVAGTLGAERPAAARGRPVRPPHAGGVEHAATRAEHRGPRRCRREHGDVRRGGLVARRCAGAARRAGHHGRRCAFDRRRAARCARPGDPADAALAGGAVPGNRAGRARERSPRAVRRRARPRRNRAERSAGGGPGRRAGDRPCEPTHGSSRFRPICPPMRWARGLRPSLPWPRRCAARSIWRWARSTTRACRCSACVRPCSSAAMALRPSAMPGSRCPARPKSASRASSRAPARMRSCAAS